MATPQTPDRKTRLLVFDRFYAVTPEGSDREQAQAYRTGMDSVTRSLNPERHEVVGSARTIAQACELLIALKEGSLEDVQAIVLGGTLEGDFRYTRSPVAHTAEQTTLRKNLFGLGRTRELTELVTTHLVPVVDAKGAIVLPTKREEGPLSLLERAKIETPIAGIAGYVLSHVINTYLDEEARPKVILHSGDIDEPHNADLPVDAKVMKRYGDNPDSELARAIDRLTKEPR